MLYVDTPTIQELHFLREVRADACLSIYLPTSPVTTETEAERLELGEMIKTAVTQLDESGFDKRQRANLIGQVEDLLEDDEFWRFQSRSLAILATPEVIRTFRLANRLPKRVEIADRFYLKPLLRAITFPHDAFVLALSENDVRLIEVFPDLPPQRLHVDGLPKDAASAIGVSSINNRMSMRRVMGGEGQKVRLTQYARMVDAAIRPVLAGRETPLILAATEPLASLFRAVSNYPNLVPETINTTNDRSTESDIAAAAVPILDAAHARSLDEAKKLFEQRAGQDRATTDIAEAARAATFGAIETLLVDLDQMVHGVVDEQTGVVTFRSEGPDTYGVVDEIMGRAMRTGAHVLAARADDIPGGGALAATLRYPF
jgi:hypothetical protein